MPGVCTPPLLTPEIIAAAAKYKKLYAKTEKKKKKPVPSNTLCDTAMSESDSALPEAAEEDTAQDTLPPVSPSPSLVESDINILQLSAAALAALSLSQPHVAEPRSSLCNDDSEG